MNFAIYEKLNEHGIEIPFPQRDLHIRSGALELKDGMPAASVTLPQSAPGRSEAPVG